MPRACPVESHASSYVATSVNLHGTSPWHLEIELPVCSSNRESPRDKPVASHAVWLGLIFKDHKSVPLFPQEPQMSKQAHINLSRRERQIMDIIYQRGQATAAEVTECLPDPPSYSAVRAMLRLLEEKGHLRHEQDGPRYVFKPTLARDRAKKSALKQMLQTFFDGSIEQAVATLLDVSRSKISQEELDRLSQLIEEARKEGR